MKTNKVIEKIIQNWRGFPNIGILGKYEFLSQTVCANSLEIKHLEDLIKDPSDIQLKRKIFGVIIHEITHWLDHTSTLWGQKFLIDIFNAFNAKSNENIDELWRIQHLFSDINRMYFADYYTVNGSAAEEPWNKEPWRYDFGCGLQFSREGKTSEKHPFFYTIFSTSNDEFITRVPLSVMSLLETNAVTSEVRLETVLLSCLNQGEVFIENKLIEQNFLERLYTPELTRYSVAAHCLANLAKITDAVDAYFLSSALSTLCLNLPSKVFPLLKIPSALQERIGDRAREMLNLQDRGFAFFIIANYASQYNQSDIVSWLESTIEAAGLPPLKQLEELANQEMNELNEQILKDPLIEKLKEIGLSETGENQIICEYSRLKNLLRVGRDNFTKRGIAGNHEISMKTIFSVNENYLKLPPILLGDDSVIQLGDEALEPEYQDVKKWIEYVDIIEERLREFHQACFI
ncbi:MAG: hypothetical protein PUP91_07060 [Rhizonema sp. PD37]|nr:hypothetical protein [Rhizonema sp. PD37]